MMVDRQSFLSRHCIFTQSLSKSSNLGLNFDCEMLIKILKYGFLKEQVECFVRWRTMTDKNKN